MIDLWCTHYSSYWTHVDSKTMYMQTTFGVSTHQYNRVGSEIYKRRIHSSNELNALCWRISTQIHLIRNTSSLPDVEKRLWCGVVPTCQSKDKNQFHLRYNGLLIYKIYFFRQITTFIKVRGAFFFWASDPLIERF